MVVKRTTRARYNLKTARRARTAGLTTTAVLVFASFVMTCVYFHGVSERSSSLQTVFEPSIGRDEADEARVPTDEDIAVFVSLFPGSPLPKTTEREVAAATEFQHSTGPVGPATPEQRVIAERTSGGDVAGPRGRLDRTPDRTAPIGTIATSRGEYSIHRDTHGRVFAERIFSEHADATTDTQGAENNE